MASSALNAQRRASELDHLGNGERVDVLVVGGGITGVGVALDAASRGLRTVLVERYDLAYGTSRWSSKLVHGGLRYLATGDVGLAYESAYERRILMSRTAPHLVRPVPQLVPLRSGTPIGERLFTRAGLVAGDAVRVAARTRRGLLPRSRRIGTSEALRFAPTLRSDDLAGGLLGWDGQLTDDARLVVAVARTAAARGASVLTRVSASAVTDTSARLRDELSGESFDVAARAVVNASGVWAGSVDPAVGLRPSRGTHLVVPGEAVGGLNAVLTVPIPGESNRYVLVIPAPHGRAYIGLTDEPAPGPVPDVPEPTASEVDGLLATVSSAMRVPLSRADVVGAFAGLRPLLDGSDERTADLSRRHAVLRAAGRPITVVGGKLTTYRRMASDAVDAAVTDARLVAGPCRTDRIRLVGAGGGATGPRASGTLVARYGDEAGQVMASGGADGLEPVCAGSDVCRAELSFGMTHEGALEVDDLLDRRTRIGLVTADRERALPAAEAAVAHARSPSGTP